MKVRPLPVDILKGIDDPFWTKVDVRGASDCWEWTGSREPAGYGRVKRRRAYWVTSRIALALVGREVPVDRVVCHSCDNPPCVNPMHLFLGTNAENAADCRAKGRASKRTGINNTRCKLTENQVREIRSSPEQAASLSKRFGVSHTTIRDIKNRRRWGHLS